MKKFIIVFLLSITIPVYAGTITFNLGGSTVTRTTNAAQDTKITRLLAKENALRAARTPPDPAITAEQFLDLVFVATLAGYSRQADDSEKGDFCAAFSGLTTAQKNQITSLGGSNSPCP